jgi:hypothetical protein
VGRWRAQGDDLRTFISELVAALPRIELPLVSKLYPAGLLECGFSGRMDGEPSRTLPMKMALQFREQAGGCNIAALPEPKNEIPGDVVLGG